MKKTKTISPEARKMLAQWGRKGGLAGSREAKSRAGKKGHAAMIQSIENKVAEKH